MKRFLLPAAFLAAVILVIEVFFFEWIHPSLKLKIVAGAMLVLFLFGSWTILREKKIQLPQFKMCLSGILLGIYPEFFPVFKWIEEFFVLLFVVLFHLGPVRQFLFHIKQQFVRIKTAVYIPLRDE